MTELSGGRAFSVENINDLPDIATKIGSELRNQYTLGYRPTDKSHDARWRKIKIKLRAPEDCRLSASPGKQVTTGPASEFFWLQELGTVGTTSGLCAFALPSENSGRHMIFFSEGDQSGERDLRSARPSGEDRNLDAAGRQG